MVFIPVVAGAIVAGLLLGGRLGAIAGIRVHAAWLLFAALALQIAAFPSGLLPWSPGDSLATALWGASYGCLLPACFVNRRLPGVALVAAGMSSNLVAVVANGGHMPVLREAMRGADMDYTLRNNSAALPAPKLAVLVDRWAVPDWIPFGNVFSMGDVAIALGAAVLVLTAMGARGFRGLATAPQPQSA